MTEQNKAGQIASQIIAKSEAYNEGILRARRIQRLMAYPEWDDYYLEIKELETLLTKPDILSLHNAKALYKAQGIVIAFRNILQISTLVEQKASEEMLDEAKAVALFGESIAESVEQHNS